MTNTTNSAEESPNPYEASSVKSDGTSEGSSLRLSVTFFIALALSSGLFLAVVFTQSRFESIFADFDTELPFPTIAALSPGMLIVTGALFLFTVAKEFIGIHKRLVRLCNGFSCLAALSLGFVYAVAMFLPLISLIEDLA